MKIVFGTDAGGFAWTALPQARELKYYVEYGMTPMAAVRSATAVAAELLGWQDRLGTIEGGTLGDIISVAGDRLADMTERERVRFVMKASCLQTPVGAGHTPPAGLNPQSGRV